MVGATQNLSIVHLYEVLQVKEGELFTGFGQFPGALAAGCTVSSDQQADAAEAVGFGHGRLQVPVGAVWIRACSRAEGPNTSARSQSCSDDCFPSARLSIWRKQTNKQNRATV